MKNRFNNTKAYQRHIWDYENANIDNFRQQLDRSDWESCFDFDDIDRVCDAWSCTFLNVARENIPNKVVTIRPGDKIFFNQELRLLRRKKNRAHKKAKKMNTPFSWEKF